MAHNYIPQSVSNSLYEGIVMVDKAKVKIYSSGSKRIINLPIKLVDDSAFPFKVGEDLSVRIDNGRLVIERIGKGSK